MSEMGNKVSGVLKKQEEEFLCAYRAHLRNVEGDFGALRTELDEKERSIAENEKVLSLEKERDWYKKEVGTTIGIHFSLSLPRLHTSTSPPSLHRLTTL
mmetsp:Transcript_19599/g.57034  ORF Transcript_19599/g.57034 Transcript_19599/m.57034 type:complete len:99 (-) Transcript_19599:666-962(-)